ncbi:MAG TPA: indole-3-glycerol phosphate synthase TrpC [Bryobacteraceae bacterium]|nr:indole-3-glycerol phosphate synthase TrpC [Bryobacteraceae bacterium]
MTTRVAAGILGEIVLSKQQELGALRPQLSHFEELAAVTRASRRNFAAALRAHKTAIIAEVKKASPSKGLLQHNFHPEQTARQYEAGGAACISVLTDAKYFQGGLQDLEAARAAIALPVLRKDFTIDPIQIYQAAAHGADAILLIAAILDDNQLKTYRELAARLHLAALVEVHDEEELVRAIDSGAEIIGVNNRNLETFEVTLETSLRLSERMPANVTRVSESGIFQRRDIELLQGAGFHAFLIGESLMKAGDPVAALKALV